VRRWAVTLPPGEIKTHAGAEARTDGHLVFTKEDPLGPNEATLSDIQHAALNSKIETWPYHKLYGTTLIHPRRCPLLQHGASPRG